MAFVIVEWLDDSTNTPVSFIIKESWLADVIDDKNVYITI